LGRISDKKSRNIAQEKEQRRGQKKEYALVFVEDEVWFSVIKIAPTLSMFTWTGSSRGIPRNIRI
jgi:hypothetical protein